MIGLFRWLWCRATEHKWQQHVYAGTDGMESFTCLRCGDFTFDRPAKYQAATYQE